MSYKIGKFVILASLLTLSACSSNGLKRAELHISKNDWVRAVMEYRSELERDPGNVGVKSSLIHTELRAAEYYFHAGMMQLTKNDYDSAIGLFEQGLVAMPGNEKLQVSLRTAMAMRERSSLLKEAQRYKELGDLDKERHILQRAIELVPGDVAVLQSWRDYAARADNTQQDEFALSSDENITLNFRDAPIKTAFNFLSEEFGVNFIFDEAITDKKLTLFARNVSFRQALNLMLSTTLTFYKKVADNTLLLAPDTKDKRGQYDDYLIRTYSLNSIPAKEMADILKGVLSLQKVVVNDALNSLTIRATDKNLELASSLIRANDRKPAEIILEVEILEVDKQKALHLGFDYGSLMTLEFPPYSVSGPFSETLAQGTLTLPSVSFHYFKQNVDAETLANPKVRVVDGKKAKIHIGDRVPLRSSTIQDATGQTRTTFQYTDIGIRLQVEPQVQLDNSTLVNLSLEVSSLGQNLGTQAEPAFSIGTRNAETQMLLRDGETAILGGLIRDEDRRVRVKVPGLGDIPILGYIFSSMDDSVSRTDVLLTITPRIIRPWHLPPQDTRVLYSGTAERYFTQPRLTMEQDDSEPDEILFVDTQHGSEVGQEFLLKLDHSRYRSTSGEEFVVGIVQTASERTGKMTLRMQYDDQILEYVAFEPVSPGILAEVDNDSSGELRVSLTLPSAETQGTKLSDFGKFIFKSKRKGVAYIILGGGGISDDVSEMQYLIHSDSAYVVVD